MFSQDMFSKGIEEKFGILFLFFSYSYLNVLLKYAFRIYFVEHDSDFIFLVIIHNKSF